MKPTKQNSDREAMDRELRATCRVLETVAKGFPGGSVERRAIRQAADAFVYLHLHAELKERYDAFQSRCKKPLTKAQQQALKRAGVAL